MLINDNLNIKMRKKAFKLIVASIIIIIVFLAGGSIYMLRYALGSQKAAYDEYYEMLYQQEPDIKIWVDSLKQIGELRDTVVVLSNGENSHALLATKKDACGRTAILVHGYKDAAVKMLPYARLYHDMGMNILLPDLHGHGLSDGSDIQMGWKDRLTIEEWMNIAANTFTLPDDTTRIYLHGISMGAATVMNVAGDNPQYLVAVVEDSGYTNVWEEFAQELRNQFSLPTFPLMYTTSALCKLVYGWTFEEASPLRQVAKAQCPILFIHGDADDFVPTSMVYPLYDAKNGYKEIWVTKGSKHVKSLHDHPEEYKEKIEAFVSH